MLRLVPLRPVVRNVSLNVARRCCGTPCSVHRSNAQDKVRPQRLCVLLDRATGSAQESAAPIPDSHRHGKGYLIDYAVSSDSDQIGRG
jgi:hypothetical protein